MGRSLSPPGHVEDVAARSVLVLAPHHDDEVLGCGGLLARLAVGGAMVRVLFLTDGSGGVEALPAEGSRSSPEEVAAARRAHAGRRFEEARCAAAALGVHRIDQLAFSDGALEQRLDELAAAITAAIDDGDPDLVLVPSPLEATPDHRAAFAALHRALHPLRDKAAVARARLRVLAYEVNHPAYPDLLVDVGDQLETLSRAMRCHASQLERHDYLEAALGLRRFRTHSLPPGVVAAEGYSRLSLEDFTTRSLSHLVAHLGGAPERLEVVAGPLVSVVVRTRDRPELLAEALASIAASEYRRLEVVLVNDGGALPAVPADYPFEIRRVELSASRGRAGAANAGLDAARGELVGFLDDDDLVYPEHYATQVDALHAATVSAVYTDAVVAVYELRAGESLDGRGPRGWECVERRLPYSRDFDPDVLLLDNYVPFHTLLFERRLVEQVGPLDESLPVFEDWDFLLRLAERTPLFHLARVTCEYRHFRALRHHVLAGRAVDREALFLETKARVYEKHATLLSPERLAAAVTRLRRETVEAAEGRGRSLEQAVELERRLVVAAREHHDLWLRLERTDLERDRVQQRLFDVEKDYHRLHGEVVALRADRERLQGELQQAAARLQRSFDQEAELRRVVDDQTEHLRRTYAEIERLGSLVREMESTRAWRLHRLLERRRS
ncbi:MAG TPA: PIG-L family deacetylase [Thermoanaerobaculia bacterium]|nr:PIG-L family deacetylase [Thermoanaerobaculia bacterium]